MSYLIKPNFHLSTYASALRAAKLIFDATNEPVVIYRAYTTVIKEDNHWVEDFFEASTETIATGQEHKK